MRIFILILVLLVFVSQASAAPEDAFLKLGKEFLKSGNYDKAAKNFTNAVRINPANAEAQKGLGIAYFHLGSNEYATNPEVLDKSVGALFEAARLSPEPESLYYLGLALLDLGYKDDSMQVCNSLQQIDSAKAKLLSGKIANFKEPEKYHYLQNEHNLNEEYKEYLGAVAEQQRQAKIARARAEQEERQRMFSAIENARRSAEVATRRAKRAEATSRAIWAEAESRKASDDSGNTHLRSENSRLESENSGLESKTRRLESENSGLESKTRRLESESDSMRHERDYERDRMRDQGW